MLHLFCSNINYGVFSFPLPSLLPYPLEMCKCSREEGEGVPACSGKQAEGDLSPEATQRSQDHHGQCTGRLNVCARVYMCPCQRKPTIRLKFQISRYWYHVVARYSFYATLKSESRWRVPFSSNVRPRTGT